jgi:hypothetical protein
MFLFSTSSRPTLGPTQPPIHAYKGLFRCGVKWQRREADHSSPSRAAVKKDGVIPPFLHYLYGIAFNYLSTGTTLPFLVNTRHLGKNTVLRILWECLCYDDFQTSHLHVATFLGLP